MIVNNDYGITIYLTDTGGVPISGGNIVLSVTSPDGLSTISPPSVTTNGTGYATATLHTSTKAGINNVAAVYDSNPYVTPLQVNPDAPKTMNLARPPYKLADGFSTAAVRATIQDKFGNPVPNTPVNFAIDGANKPAVNTDSTGVATLTVGPYSYGISHIANVTASCGGINGATSIWFLFKNDLQIIKNPNTPTVGTGQLVTVTATWFDMTYNVPVVNLPLSFYAIYPDFTPIGNSSGLTDSTGSISYSFTTHSNMIGEHSVSIRNSDLSPSSIKSAVFTTTGGEVNKIILNPSPSWVYADGTSTFTFEVRTVDSNLNPVKFQNIKVVINDDLEYAQNDTTNINGYAWIIIPAEKYVLNKTVAVYTNSSNGTLITNSTILQYRAGAPAMISLIANPNVVASANVSTPPDMSDVHQTDIIATVMDIWGHPLPGQPVTIASQNTALGNITGPQTGTTNDCGEFATQFTLGNNTLGKDLTNGVPIRATTGMSIMQNTSVYYTYESFLSIKTSIDPKTNVSINDTINVDITMKGVGWRIRPQNCSVMLIFDRSGSMDWLSTTVYPTNGLPKEGTIPADTDWGINDYDDWYLIDTYTHTGGTSKQIEIMLSSNYRNYSDTGSYYELRITRPSGTNDTATRSANENYRIYSSPSNGQYKIWARYRYNPSEGHVPYNMMVLTTPKRLGQSTDTNTAAKVAARGFVDNMTNSQIGIAAFNTAGSIPLTLTMDNSANKSLIYSRINGLSATGGTEAFEGIKVAVNEFNSARYTTGNKKVAILLSDGYSQTPNNDLTWAQTAANNNITIFTIGMGMPDDQNLGEIANRTGGKYYKAYSDVQLSEIYNSISDDLKEVVANYTEMHVFTNTSINSTIMPDAEYVDGSGSIRYANGTINPAVPSAPTPYINLNGIYEIIWEPGAIKLNDTVIISYDIKVLKGGLVTPIMNDSYVSYTREDGTIDSINFTADTIYASDTPNNTSVVQSPGIKLKITTPDDPLDAGVNLSTLRQPVIWYVDYGYNSSTYHQDITWENVMTGKSGVFSSNDPLYDGIKSNTSHQMTWNAENWEPGTYLIKVKAYDGINTPASDEVRITIQYSSGMITLQ